MNIHRNMICIAVGAMLGASLPASAQLLGGGMQGAMGGSLGRQPLGGSLHGDFGANGQARGLAEGAGATRNAVSGTASSTAQGVRDKAGNVRDGVATTVDTARGKIDTAAATTAQAAGEGRAQVEQGVASTATQIHQIGLRQLAVRALASAGEPAAEGANAATATSLALDVNPAEQVSLATPEHSLDVEAGLLGGAVVQPDAISLDTSVAGGIDLARTGAE